jgi:hydrogenase/urease accessory protein HupE
MQFPGFLRQFCLLLLFTFAIAIGSTVHAHNSSKGLTAVRIESLETNLNVTLAIAFFDVEVLHRLDKNGNGEIAKEEVTATLAELKSTAEKELQISFNGKLLTPTEAKASLQESNFEVALKFPPVGNGMLKVRSPFISRLTPDHQQIISLIDPKTGERLVEQTILPPSPECEFAISGKTAVATTEPAQSRFITFLKHGVKHILGGYDHLLFLFALLILCEKFWGVVKIITCFTIAHSISLALSTFNIASIPSNVVEPMIAITIIYVGLENMFKLKTIEWRWLVTFVFGLIHGFAFANELREKGLGEGTQIVVPLFAFNVGVEIGQICIAALVLPILWQLHKIPSFAPRWVPAASAAVVIMGGYWFVQRVWF